MLLQIFGLTSGPAWWRLNRMPQNGGTELAQSLASTLENAEYLNFYITARRLQTFSADELAHLWEQGHISLVARPRVSSPPARLDSKLRLITIEGPDAGRILPLSRQVLSVGRSTARAMIRDPWLSSHEFDISLTPNGIRLTSLSGSHLTIDDDYTFVAGTTRFQLQRGPCQPILPPRECGDFRISPGQPPSPPNLILQIIGAVAPLLIGIVLMLVTGMWYFLLFSGISVIIATVLITQYRKARQRYIQAISSALQRTKHTRRQKIFSPAQLSLALESPGKDPLALASQQPTQPVVHLGVGICEASIDQVQDVGRWRPFLGARIDLILSLSPGKVTLIVGDPIVLRPLKNWCVAQLLRHAKASNTGIILDGNLIGGPATVEISEDAGSSSRQLVHQLIFTTATTAHTSPDITYIDLHDMLLDGKESAREIEVVGISDTTLERFSEAIAIDAPNHHTHQNPLKISKVSPQNNTSNHLCSSLGTGSLHLNVDLVQDGPHILITGTTGSGKSELLLTLLIGVVEQYPPTEVSLILLDFKGGSSFNVLTELPHTMSVETNHVSSTSLRSLEAIAAELFRREALFTQHGVSDYVGLRKKMPHLTIPRLIVAIDELRVLVDQNPNAATTLTRLAATGRSLGFHLVIATQRNNGAVSADMRANIGATITLRTATEQDSWEVLGNAEAHHISTETPGRAYFKAGAKRAELFQTSQYVLDDEPVVITAADSSGYSSSGTDWDTVVELLIRRDGDLAIPHPVILPALPAVLIREDHIQERISPGCFPLGMVDDPANCQQYPLFLSGGDIFSAGIALSRSVAFVGAADSGVENAIAAITRYVVGSKEYRVFLDGKHGTRPGPGWDYQLHVRDHNGDVLKDFLDQLGEILATGQGVHILVSDWGSWAGALVSGNYQGFDDLLVSMLRQYPLKLKVYVVGGRELAAGRLIGMIPDRIYFPMNSSAEHQLLWPKLLPVPARRARGILVTAERATGGLEVQLFTDS